MNKQTLLSRMPLWLQLVLIMVFAVVVVDILTSETIVKKMESKATQKMLSEQKQHTFSLYRSSIFEAVISEDIPVLESVLAQAKKEDSDLISIVIKNEDDVDLYSWTAASNSSEEDLELRGLIEQAGEVFGSIVVSWNNDSIEKQSALHQRLARIQIFISLLMMMVIALMALRYILLLPMRQISKQLQTIASGDLQSRLKPKGSAEVYQLGGAVNQLATSMQKELEIRESLQEAKQTIEEINNQNSAILKSAGEGIIGTDIDGNISFVNPAAAHTLGWQEADLLKQSLLLVLFNGAKPTGEYLWQDALNQLFYHEYDEKLYRKDGSSFYANFSCTPLRKQAGPESLFDNEADKISAGWVFVFNDTSIDKQNENKLKEAQQAAEAANRAKSEFLATMSHEIRTPLNAIINLNHLLLSSSLTKKQREFATVARDSGKALLSVIGGILDLSKIESGIMPLAQTPFSPTDLSKSVLALFAATAIEKNIKLECKLEKLPEQVNGDQVKLRQVLINLLGNAVKFTNKGTITLSCSVDKQFIKFKVKDSGIGVNKENKSVIFNKFQQVDSRRNKHFQGSGLGLAISKKLVELMGGSIGVYDHKAQGSTFWFTAGISHENNHPFEAKDSSYNTKALTSISSHISTKDKKILLVEDSPANQLVIKTILNNAGFEIIIANNGIEAIEQTTNTHFDLILMDLCMPKMDGLEATAIIRDADLTTPIIAITANAFEDDRQICLSAGMNDFISKPIDKEQMLDTLQVQLKVQQNTSPSQEKSKTNIKPLLDGQKIDTLAQEINQEGLINMLILFKKETNRRLKIISEHEQGKDINTIKREAHTLKSCAGSFGAEQIAELCSQLEKACTEDDFTKQKSICLQLEITSKNTFEVLKEQYNI